MSKVSFVDLTQIEQDVMVQLAQQRTISLVALAADMWRTTPDWQAFDPFPLVTFVVESLCERSLVRFRLSELHGEHKDQPFDIRLTQQGWELMGYARYTVEVGTPSRHSAVPVHTSDGTNYRNHHFSAQGGPIETDDFPTHRANYPAHIHMYGDIQMVDTGTAQDTGDMTRPYTRVTPDMEAAVIHARNKLGMTAGYKDIAEMAEVPERTVKYVLTDLPRLRRTSRGDDKAAHTLKERIYVTVQTLGEVKDVAGLRRILGMADSEHDVMHVLHSLHTQGKIDFTERGSGMGKATVIDIRLPKKGRYVAGPKAEPEAATAEEPLPATPSPAPEQPEGYPLLDELLDRERNRMERDGKAMAYVTAAEAIEKVDPETAAELMRKAEAFDTTFPSPLEREYVRYVANHTKETA